MRFLVVLLTLIFSTGFSFFDSESTIKNVEKCINENQSTLVSKKTIRRECIKKYELKESYSKKAYKVYFGKLEIGYKIENNTYKIKLLRGENKSKKIITGLDIFIDFYNENGKRQIFSATIPKRVFTFITPGEFSHTFEPLISIDVLPNYKSCKNNTQKKSCLDFEVRSIYTLEIGV